METIKPSKAISTVKISLSKRIMSKLRIQKKASSSFWSENPRNKNRRNWIGRKLRNELIAGTKKRKSSQVLKPIKFISRKYKPDMKHMMMKTLRFQASDKAIMGLMMKLWWLIYLNQKGKLSILRRIILLWHKDSHWDNLHMKIRHLCLLIDRNEECTIRLKNWHNSTMKFMEIEKNLKFGMILSLSQLFQ